MIQLQMRPDQKIQKPWLSSLVLMAFWAGYIFGFLPSKDRWQQEKREWFGAFTQQVESEPSLPMSYQHLTVEEWLLLKKEGVTVGSYPAIDDLLQRYSEIESFGQFLEGHAGWLKGAIQCYFLPWWILVGLTFIAWWVLPLLEQLISRWMYVPVLVLLAGAPAQLYDWFLGLDTWPWSALVPLLLLQVAFLALLWQPHRTWVWVRWWRHEETPLSPLWRWLAFLLALVGFLWVWQDEQLLYHAAIPPLVLRLALLSSLKKKDDQDESKTDDGGLQSRFLQAQAVHDQKTMERLTKIVLKRSLGQPKALISWVYFFLREGALLQAQQTADLLINGWQKDQALWTHREQVMDLIHQGLNLRKDFLQALAEQSFREKQRGTLRDLWRYCLTLENNDEWLDAFWLRTYEQPWVNSDEAKKAMVDLERRKIFPQTLASLKKRMAEHSESSLYVDNYQKQDKNLHRVVEITLWAFSEEGVEVAVRQKRQRIPWANIHGMLPLNWRGAIWGCFIVEQGGRFFAAIFDPQQYPDWQVISGRFAGPHATLFEGSDPVMILGEDARSAIEQWWLTP